MWTNIHNPIQKRTSIYFQCLETFLSLEVKTVRSYWYFNWVFPHLSILITERKIPYQNWKITTDLKEDLKPKKVDFIFEIINMWNIFFQVVHYFRRKRDNRLISYRRRNLFIRTLFKTLNKTRLWKVWKNVW